MRTAPRSDRLPMLLWEGPLEAWELVIVIPTIWEWDGGNAPLKSKYTQAVNNYLSSATGEAGHASIRFEGGDVFGAGDRPIGMLNGDWAPQGIFLTKELARFAVTSSPSHIANGVVEIRYAAETEDYSLYFKIERLP